MDEENQYQRKLRETKQKLLEATDSGNITEYLVKSVYGEDFGLPFRLLDTKVEAYGEHIPELADAVAKIKSYNDFRGEDVAGTIRYLHDRGYLMNAKFGREGSPVLYLQPPYWTNQKSNYDGVEEHRKYDEHETWRMYKEIVAKMSELEPDELDYNESYGVRAWWD